MSPHAPVELRPRVDQLKELRKELVMHDGRDVLAGWRLDVEMAVALLH